MQDAKIEQLIINPPYTEPLYHWEYDKEHECFNKVRGRRRSGYFVAKEGAKAYDTDGRFIELELVNRIRERVRAWRESGYTGITGTTRKLLDCWHDEDAHKEQPFFFCQIDAIETLIFLAEAPDSLRTGLDIPSDGAFRRLCTKLCTGGGKTVVMAMLIAWQVCNKAAYARDKRFTKNILAVAPNLTVKKRLEVLKTGGEKNYYDAFGIVPPELGDYLRQGKVIVVNWQALQWDSPEDIARRKSVDKRGAKSDNAYSREIVGDMKNILVINDEAHHAWRPTARMKKRLTREEKEAKHEATVWIEGLDRIDRARHITACYDFSATPFVPGMSRNDEEALFGWIVSDYSLSDGIEAGIVKTPRLAFRDDKNPDPQTYRSKLAHIYADPEVKASLNSDDVSLPGLVKEAYMLLAHDWQKTFEVWKSAGKSVPPVMITVANKVETAARIEGAFAGINADLAGHMLRIDSGILDGMKTAEAESLRETVDTVGQEGRPGGDVRNVISVGMLSEGWDARTVTHIMGLRAFSSQLLCEQVVGRGLRRTSYDRPDCAGRPEGEDGLFSPEYVNVFGIPFTFLPHEDATGKVIVDAPKTLIRIEQERAEYAIIWPNVSRLEYGITQTLGLDVKSVPELVLEAQRLTAELAPVLDGRTDTTRTGTIELDVSGVRMQRVIFSAVSGVYDSVNASWQDGGTKLALIGQVIRLTEEYLRDGALHVVGAGLSAEGRREVVIAANMERIVRHIWQYITSEKAESVTAVLDTQRRERSTWDMRSWYTGRPSSITRKSHVNRSVHDSTYEATEAFRLDNNEHVKAWAKNDHLGFSVGYVYGGIVRRYLPDFLVRLDNGEMLILETKGIITEQDRVKFAALEEWCKGVNALGVYGRWHCDMTANPYNVDTIIENYMERIYPNDRQHKGEGTRRSSPCNMGNS